LRLFGDPPGFRLDDCATQRNLTDEGRGHAKRIGEAFRAHAIPVERVLSSPWCRCVLTGISPATGELVIVTPQGDGRFAVARRLGVD